MSEKNQVEEIKGLVSNLQTRAEEVAKKSAGEVREEFEKRNKDIDARLEAVEKAAARPVTPVENPSEQKAALIKKANVKLRSFLREMFKTNYHGPQSFDIVSPDVAEAKGLASDSDPAGGYLVHPTMSSDMDKKVFEKDPMRQMASSVTIGTDSFKENAEYGDPDVNWVGERQTRSATDSMELKQLEIPVREMEQMPSLTQNLIDDAEFPLEQYIIELASEAFARKEGLGFVSGSGGLQPKGFLSYASGDAHGSVEQVVSGVSADFDGDDLIGLQDTLLEHFQPGASWAMRRATRSFCRTLKDGQGRYLFSVDGGLNGGVQELLLGKPINLLPSMPAIGANSLSVAYGDFKKGYLIVDRAGLRILRDPYTSKPNILLYMTRRVGGGVRAFQAIKLLKLAVS